MILAETFDCVVPQITAKTETLIHCAYQVSSEPTPWELGSSIANWGILGIAALALLVSALSRRDAQLAMKMTLDENYKATQAQLDASRVATRADLDERKNARELEMTAEYVSATDVLFLAASSLASDENREADIRRGANDLVLAAGRFNLFVMEAPALRTFQEQFVALINKFKPMSAEDYDSQEFARLFQLHTMLRTEIAGCQKDRGISTGFRAVMAALKEGNLNLADHMLGLKTD